ncbi:hypothetical protein STEG23_034221, partial [Scotinomys teguina]
SCLSAKHLVTMDLMDTPIPILPAGDSELMTADTRRSNFKAALTANRNPQRKDQVNKRQAGRIHMLSQGQQVQYPETQDHPRTGTALKGTLLLRPYCLSLTFTEVWTPVNKLISPGTHGAPAGLREMDSRDKRSPWKEAVVLRTATRKEEMLHDEFEVCSI